MSLITQYNYYQGLIKIIRYYIQDCHSCKCAKVLQDQYNNLLKPLPILSHPLSNIILNFITRLSINNSYNTNLMIVNYLTKEKYYILYTTDNNGTTIGATIKLLLQNI